MAVFTRDQLEQHVAMDEKGDKYIEEYPQSGDVPSRPALPDFRVDIRRAIYDAVINAGGAVNRAAIAKAVKRKKSAWLVERIESLVADGYLTRSQTYWKNGVVMYYYEVAGR